MTHSVFSSSRRALAASLLTACTAVPAVAQDGPSALEAEDITVDEQSGEITAAGDVLLESGGSRLSTGRLRLNRDAGRLEVPGPLTLKEADGSTLKAEAARLDDRLDSGVLMGLDLTPAEGGRFAARRAEKTGSELRLDGAVFTACPACEDDPDADPLWQIRAARIDYDRAGQNVLHRHARLEVFGWPMFYLPVMAHAGPEVTRRSGFLAPSLASSGDFGGAVETPYFFDLAPNYDLTLTPRVSEKQDPFITADWRHLTSAGTYEATLYGHAPKGELQTDPDRDLRSGLIGRGRFTAGGWTIDLGVEQASDDLFFRSYRINSQSQLHNRAVLTRRFGNQSVAVETHHFRNMTSAETADTVTAVLPRLRHSLYLDDAGFGGSLTVATTLSRDVRDLGIDVDRLSSRLDWSWQHVSGGGFVWSVDNRLALDAFSLTAEDDNAAQQAEVDAAEEALAANAAAFGLAYPLRRVTARDTQTLTPRAQLVLATDNEDYDSVPHVSLGTPDLNAAQLFQGTAPKDETSRVNLGLGHELALGAKLRSELFFGQSYNLSDRDTFSEASGYGARRSALLADWALYAGPLSLSQNARFDKTGSRLLRSESSAGLAFHRLSLSAAHSFYETGQQADGVLEEGSAALDWQVAQNWQLTASARENLETKQPVRSEAVLSYEDDCTQLAFTLTRDYSRISGSNIEPETSLNFTFTLKTIGG